MNIFAMYINSEPVSVRPSSVSVVTTAGRVQKIPTLAPIHIPSLTWKVSPNGMEFLAVRTVAEVTFH
jgi:hypothetical protein